MSGVIQSVGALLNERPPKTTPTLRASASAFVNGTTNTTSITVTIPASAQVGDFALFIFGGNSSRTVPTVSGLTFLGVSPEGDASQPPLFAWSKWIESGDPGSDVTFTHDKKGLSAAVAVYADTSGLSGFPYFTFTDQRATTSGADPTFGSISTGPDDLWVAASSTLSQLTLNTKPLMTTAPTGATIDENVGNTSQAGALGVSSAISLVHAPSHDPRVESADYAVNVFQSSLVLALAPKGPSLADRNIAPGGVLDLPVYTYSDSSGARIVYSQTVNTRGCNTYLPWPERIEVAAGTHGSTSNNMAVGGMRSCDVTAFAYGSGAKPTRAYLGSPFAVAQTGTETALGNRLDALFLTDLIGNDAIALHAGTKAGDSARNSVDALFRLIRASAVYPHTLSGFTKTGTWTTYGSNGLFGGSSALTKEPGATVTFPNLGASVVEVVLVGLDDADVGFTGSTFDISVDGTVVYSGTTSNQGIASGSSVGDYGFTQMVVPVECGPGTHTLALTHTGAANDALNLNCTMVPSENPPWIVTNKMPPLPAASYTSLDFTPADAAFFNDLLVAVADSFTDGKVIVYDPTARGSWDPATHISDGDGLHQSELGHEHYADEILRLLNEHIA